MGIPLFILKGFSFLDLLNFSFFRGRKNECVRTQGILGCARPLNFSLAELCTENTFPYSMFGGSARKCTKHTVCGSCYTGDFLGFPERKCQLTGLASFGFAMGIVYGKHVSVHNSWRKCTEVHETHSVWFVFCGVEMMLKRYGAAKGIVYGKHVFVHYYRR